jgi:CheY-like chemotaxis protein
MPKSHCVYGPCYWAGKGYAVLTASSAEDGFELSKQNAVDLVIADHFLRGKTGTEIAREMKERKPQIPIPIVSAAAEMPAGLEFIDGFLANGDQPEILLQTITHLLAVAAAALDGS